MRPALDARLRYREPEPGLLNLPIPLPSVPILSPILTPLVGGAPAAESPQPNPASAPPATTAQAPPPPSTPSASSPSNGGGTSSGGSSGSSGNGGNTPSSGGDGGSSSPSSGGSSSPSSGGSGSPPSGSSNGSGSGSGGNPPQGNSGSDTPSAPASGTSGSEGSLTVSGSTTFRVTPTGVVALPLNNAESTPSSGSASTAGGDTVQSASGQSASATTDASGTPITLEGSQAVSGSSHATTGGSSSGSSNGGDASSGPAGANPASASGSSQSHMSSGAIAGIVATVLIVCAAFVFVVLRKRYKRRKDERRVEWINGYISNDSPDMVQRNSMRSSWGTPVEHRFSIPNPFRWSTGDSPAGSEEGVFHDAGSPYMYGHSSTGAPVLPMPVHSPTDERSRGPEDPFSDITPTPQPLKRMSSLPIRISLISNGSDARDPFDDVHEYRTDDHESVPESAISSATFGHGSGLGSANGTQAHFPMPPPTAGSASTVFAIGSPTELLTPGILISFPDSPISPTFAASGTSSYPRRASVKQRFQPSQERRDEVRLERGDQVSVVSIYEDGWAFIQREKNNERGLVPLTCLEIDNP